MPLNASTPPSLLAALREEVAFDALGEAVGNVTAGKGFLEGRALHVGIVENRSASGAIGVAEARRLGALLDAAGEEEAPAVLFLESAGARVSEGLRALGAFRRLYAAALRARLAGAKLAVLVGRHCYGGSSMLANLAPRRLLSPDTRLAMSGPSVIAAAAGMDPLDEAFRAMVDATIGAPARRKATTANAVWPAEGPLGAWLRQAFESPGNLVDECRARHRELGERLGPQPPMAAQAIRRRDLDRIYPGGCDLAEAAGLVTGRGKDESGEEPFVGIVGPAPLGAERAWRLAAAAWEHFGAPPARLRVFLDCATQAARLDDERIVLSEYIVGMSFPLALLAARGTRVELTVLGKAGGGVYVALAGPAQHVSAVHGADIQMLPGAALEAILGAGRDTPATPAEWRAAGVAEEELKLGLVP